MLYKLHSGIEPQAGRLSRLSLIIVAISIGTVTGVLSASVLIYGQIQTMSPVLTAHLSPADVQSGDLHVQSINPMDQAETVSQVQPAVPDSNPVTASQLQ